MNLTINAPPGSTNHGDPNLICTPPAWYDYVLFFFTNYLAHAATIVSLPGQTVAETVSIAMVALLMPSSGIMRALEIFLAHPSLRKGNQLRTVNAAKGLCMVIRVLEDHRGRSDIDRSQFPGASNLDLIRRLNKIHGKSHLPVGYAFAYVPDHAPVSLWRSTEAGDQGEPMQVTGPEAELEAGQATRPTTLQSRARKLFERKTEISGSYNLPKAVISFAQALWAIVTLYRARGNQIEQYGYAAFGLTVAPYAYMSLINLTATCLSPEYPAIYMVRTKIMDEAEEHGGMFAGEVGYLEMDGFQFDYNSNTLIAWGLGFVVSLIPLALVGGLSRFHPGQSTALERGFTMAWLVISSAGGLWGYLILEELFNGETNWDRFKKERKKYEGLKSIAIVTLSVSPLAVPSLGGFIMVGKMLGDYGTCSRFS